MLSDRMKMIERTLTKSGRDLITSLSKEIINIKNLTVIYKF